jgi:hypothetical protein
LLDVLGKRIDHRAFVITLVCPEEPAVNERVDLATVKFDRKTAKAGPTSCAASSHSLCDGFSCNNGFCRHVVNRRLAHSDVLDFQCYYHTAEDGARFCGKHVMLCSPSAAASMHAAIVQLRLLPAFPVLAVYGCQLGLAATA